MLTHAYTRDLLFHYTKHETALTYILSTKTLRLSPLSVMNDPRETDPWTFSMIVGEDMIGIDPETSGRQFLHWQQELDREMKCGCRIACLTQDQPDPHPWAGDLDVRVHTLRQGYDHDRMWAQYADNHTGVCVFFDKSKLIQRMIDHAERVGAKMIHGPVEYYHRYDPLDRDIFRAFHELSAEALRIQGAPAFAMRHREQFARGLYLTKDSDWGSEHEYRFVRIDPSDTNPSKPIDVPIDGCIRALCLGAHFPEDRYDEVRDLKRRLGIDCLVIRYMSGHLNVMPMFLDVSENDR
jgi:hypothetical protein